MINCMICLRTSENNGTLNKLNGLNRINYMITKDILASNELIIIFLLTDFRHFRFNDDI